MDKEQRLKLLQKTNPLFNTDLIAKAISLKQGEMLGQLASTNLADVPGWEEVKEKLKGFGSTDLDEKLFIESLTLVTAISHVIAENNLNLLKLIILDV